MLNQTTEEILSTIAGMRKQEETGYVVKASLYQDQLPSSSQLPLNAQVDVDCRDKMVAWCYQVVDFCKFNRETVALAMSYLDRYLMTPAGSRARADRAIYQLAAMTAIYTAVKIHEPEAMDPTLVSKLSRGAYSPSQVEAMETEILNALNWRMNPPTTLSFVRCFLDLIPVDILTAQARETVHELARLQSELAVADYSFIEVKPSVIAFCALMNSIESLCMDDKINANIGYALSQSIGVSCNDDQVFNVQNALYMAVVRLPNGVNLQSPQRSASSFNKPTLSRRSSFEVSPRSISATR